MYKQSCLSIMCGVNMRTKLNFRLLYDSLILLLARPSLQGVYEKIFRFLYGFLGYGNWSADFKMTGELQILKKLKKFNINKILDIGANEGQWTLMARTILDSEIIAFEPQVDAFNTLSRLNDNKIKAKKLAIGDKIGEIFINVHINSSQLSFIDDHLHDMPLLNGKALIKERIQISTLDFLFENYPENYANIDFVKIDTEGYEEKVLIGGTVFFKKIRPRFIQLEINSHQIYTKTSIYSLAALLPEYNLFKILPSGSNFYPVLASSPLSNFLQLSIFLFVRRDVVI